MSADDFFSDIDDFKFEKAENSGNFEILPEGKYICTIRNAEDYEFKTNENTGSKYLHVMFSIVDSNRKIFHDFWLTEKNMPYVSRDIELITGTKIVKGSDLKDASYVGSTIGIRLKHEMYKDEPRERVSSFYQLSEKERANAEGEEVF